MRAKSIGWFFAGFATGMVVIALALWVAGRTPTAAASRQAPMADNSGVQRPVEGVSNPAGVHPAAPPAVNGEAQAGTPAAQLDAPPALPPSADRQMPDIAAATGDLSSRPLLIPVEGLRPQDLVDTFTQARSEGRSHDAVDIMAPRGTPVVAADEGNVVKLFTSKQGGLTVYQFDDSRTWCYYYAHLDHYQPGLKEGVLLRRGDRLGYVGTTGNASPEAPHLHFAIFRLGPEKRWWEGTAINPFPLLVK